MATDGTDGNEPDDDIEPLKPPSGAGGPTDTALGKLIDRPIDEELKDSYLIYAMSVIVSRALPDVRDGLKPSQRRILVAMNDLNLGPNASRVKCAKISGDTSGNYHPHGESVIYPDAWSAWPKSGTCGMCWSTSRATSVRSPGCRRPPCDTRKPGCRRSPR